MEQIYTIPVNEAFSAMLEEGGDYKCRCPFCEMHSRLEDKEIDRILGPAMMEPDVRIRTNQTGFCPTHFDLMLKGKNRLGLSLILESHVDELKGKGCTKFVFDVRNNPGGDLESIKAVLSFFLAEKDLIVSTKDKNGAEEFDYVQVVKHQDKAYAGCDVTKEDIGKYANLPFTVLTNGNTASAAELFTATVRDYKLGTIIGQTTYGKGCMQSIFSLKYYGVEGGLKLTTKMYFPASGQGYHGVGITPDISVELSPEAQEYNLYVLPEALDNQLQAAIDHMK